MRLALSSITLAKPEGSPALTALPAGSTARTAPTSPTATSTTPTDNLALRGITIRMAILLWDGTEPDCSNYSYQDRKSTRLNSSHDQISYAVFCLKKKNKNKIRFDSFTGLDLSEHVLGY